MNETFPQQETVLENSFSEDLLDATQNAIMNAAENVSEVFNASENKDSLPMSPEPFYMEIEFWVGLAFVLAILVLLKPLGKFIKRALQQRIQRTVDEIDQAVQLRDDAQKLLADYERKFVNVDQETEAILSQNEKQIRHLQKYETEKMQKQLANKEHEADRRIKEETHKVQQEINDKAGKMSVDLARRVVQKYLQNTDQKKLIDEAIKELDQLIS